VSGQLYRHFCAAGRLLYVGISSSAVRRLSEHKKSAEWFNLISRVDIENFSSREAATEAERIAVRDERPLFNIVFNGGNTVRGRRPPEPHALDGKFIAGWPEWEDDSDDYESHENPAGYNPMHALFETEIGQVICVFDDMAYIERFSWTNIDDEDFVLEGLRFLLPVADLNGNTESGFSVFDTMQELRDFAAHQSEEETARYQAMEQGLCYDDWFDHRTRVMLRYNRIRKATWLRTIA
jgi:predicted GIY-YIG superfamily endonuclease